MAQTVIGEGSGTNTLGQRLQSNIGSGRKVPQYVNKFIYISANVVPLTKLIDKMKNVAEVAGVSFFHLETDFLPTVINIDGTGYNSSATTIGVASGHSARLTVGTTLRNFATGEMLYVTAVTSDSNITVTRQAGGSSSGSLAAGAEIAIISFADTEGNTSPKGQSSEPTQKTNYVQTVRRAIEMSRRDMYTAVYGPDEAPRQMKDAFQKINMDMERMFFFNNVVDSGASSGRTMTGGIDYWLSSNIYNAAGTLTELNMIDNFIKPWFRRNDGQDGSMWAFCGENVARALDGFGRDAIRYGPDDMQIGIRVGSYQTAYGAVKFVRHGLFTPIGSSVSAANNGPQGLCYGLNMDLIGKRWFKNSKLKLRPNIQQPDTDGTKSEYLADLGVWMASEQQHAKMYGVTG